MGPLVVEKGNHGNYLKHFSIIKNTVHYISKSLQNQHFRPNFPSSIDLDIRVEHTSLVVFPIFQRLNIFHVLKGKINSINILLTMSINLFNRKPMFGKVKFLYC